MSNSPLTTSIHILDDYSLLNIFYLYRPFLLGEDGNDEGRAVGGPRLWAGEHWWFKLTRLPTMVEPHPWGSILPGPLPCVYIWHARGRYAGTLTLPSTRHRLRRG